MRKVSFRLLFFVLIFPIMSFTQEKAINSTFEMKKKVTIVADYQYTLQFPADYDDTEQLPLMVFLHGSGERGDNLDLVRVHGPWKFLEANPSYRFIVLAPQCKQGSVWDPYQLDLLVDEIVAQYPVDSDRIYLTGLSMGGFGALDLAMLRPERYAAIAPVCGASNLHRLAAQKLKDIPAWIFHGAMDNVVPYELSARLAQTLQEMDADVQFTGYPLTAHDAWTETYLDQALYDWFLQYRRSNDKK